MLLISIREQDVVQFKLLFSQFFDSAKLQRTEAAIEEYRNSIDTRKAENYGFASMAAVPYAHIVAKMIGNKRPKGTEIELAPNPKDIVCPRSHSVLSKTYLVYRSGTT